MEMILVESDYVCWLVLINIIETILQEDAWEYVLKEHSSIEILQTVQGNVRQAYTEIIPLEVVSISVHHLLLEILPHFCAFLDALLIIMLITLLKTVFQLSIVMVTQSETLQTTSASI